MPGASGDAPPQDDGKTAPERRKNKGNRKSNKGKGAAADAAPPPPKHYPLESRFVAYAFLLLFLACTASFVYLGVVRGNRALTLAQASLARAVPGAAARSARR